MIFLKCTAETRVLTKVLNQTSPREGHSVQSSSFGAVNDLSNCDFCYLQKESWLKISIFIVVIMGLILFIHIIQI